MGKSQSLGAFPSLSSCQIIIYPPFTLLQHTDIRTPDLVRMIDRNSFQKIGIDLVLRMRLAQSRLGMNRLKSHLPHQPSDSFGIDRMPHRPQPRRHLGNTIIGSPGKLLIDQPYQLQIIRIIPLRAVIIR